MELNHYFSPRDGILSRTLTEARAGRHAVDVVQVDLSYGYQLMNANLVQAYQVPGANRYFDGTFDASGNWHSMYYLTTALIYNSAAVKAEQAPKSYADLLSPSWKGKMLFDPEAGYILAAMEEAWGREKAVNYLSRLAKQDLSYRRGGTLTTQVVTSGEYPIGIAINGETSAAIREKGAPLGFKVLAPAIVKPEGLFVAKNAPHPHAALLFVEWVLSDEAQNFLAGSLGKGSAMKGVRSKFKEFQVKPDYVVNPKLGANLADLYSGLSQDYGGAVTAEHVPIVPVVQNVPIVYSDCSRSSVIMKLEIAEFPVKQIRLSHRFSYENQVLEVDEGELLALVREDARIEDVSLAVALPGEKTRITGIRDIVEPRCKVSGGGQVFAGVLGCGRRCRRGADPSAFRHDGGRGGGL